jgi:hypothetical protein
MSIDGTGTHFLSPRGVIDSSLPDLIIGKERKEIAAYSSLRYLFIGPLTLWSNFHNEVSTFYNTKALDDAFNRCDVGTGLDLEAICQKWPHFASLEHTNAAEERDLHACFLNNVMDPVVAVTKTLSNPKTSLNSKLGKLKSILPDNLKFGSAKIVPVENRENN